MINQALNASELFQTQELSLAAALLAWGFPLHHIDKTDSDKSLFYFATSPKLEQAIEDYWSGAANVSPKTYFNCLREIKSRIYGG